MAKFIPTTSIPGSLLWIGTEKDDVYNGSSEFSTADGGGGNDKMYGADRDEHLAGGEGADLIFGGNGNDDLYGEYPLLPGFPGYPGDKADFFPGNDSIAGGNGNDRIYGGAGDDILGGGFDADTIYGGAGNDTLNGDGGADWLYGGDGDDDLTGATLFGGNGQDTLHAVLSGSALYGDGGDDLIMMAGSTSNFAQAYGGAGNDSIVATAPGPMGTAGAAAFGGSGDDYISLYSGFAIGDAGNDVLEMRIGTLPGTINGGEGHDLVHAVQNTAITTGADKDRVELLNGFAPGSALEGGTWRDFEDGQDKIGVVGYGFTKYGDFIGSAAVSISQSGTSVIVSIDGQASLTLQNTDLAALDENDFYFG